MPRSRSICRAFFPLLLSSSKACSLNSSVYVRYFHFFSSIIRFLFFLVYWIWTFFVSTLSRQSQIVSKLVKRDIRRYSERVEVVPNILKKGVAMRLKLILPLVDPEQFEEPKHVVTQSVAGNI